MLSVPLKSVLAGLTLIGLAACSVPPTARPSTPTSVATSASPTQPQTGATQTSAPKTSSTTRHILGLLDQIETTELPPYHPGYDRSCERRGACQFGEEWTDRHPGRFGRNGCTTREDVLLQQLSDIEMRWGSSCRIYQASLLDPYSAERLTWREDGYWIQIDHVYPLAEAWHAGAWAWPQLRRVRFANDVRRELLAVSGRANQDKGSATPSEWLPGNRAFRCTYVRRYLVVAKAYQLTITEADREAIKRVARRCT